MRFQTTKNKFFNKWRYQAQFVHKDKAKQVDDWFAGRFVGDHEIIGDSFYTNELQDVFAVRIQFDHHLKVIREAELALPCKS
jgi:hypothetical protein